MKQFRSLAPALTVPLALLVAVVACTPGAEPRARTADSGDTPVTAETPVSKQRAARVPSAIARIAPMAGGQVSGWVRFAQQDGEIVITADISGLTPGRRGFHIHERGDCSAPDFSSAGGHFDPFGAAHGGPDGSVRHAGDLGNLEANEEGRAVARRISTLVTLDDGPTSIIGRAVIVHAGEDDLVSQPSGDAGARVACGVIEIELGSHDDS